MPYLFTRLAGPVRRLLPYLLALNLLCLVFFLAFGYQLIFHSDSAVKNLLAQEIVDSGRFFPGEWNYVNKDLWVFYTQAFIVPLLAFMPNGYAAHMLSGLVSAALIVAGAWSFTAVLGASRTARLAAMAVLTAGLSLTMAEHVWGQAAYGSMFYLAGFLVLCYWRALHAGGRARRAWLLGLALLALQIFWSNPQRALVFYFLPLLAAAAVLKLGEAGRLAQQPGLPRLPHGRTFGLFFLASLIGIALNAYTMRQVHNVRGLSVMSWLPFDGIVKHSVATVHGLLALFDGLPHLDVAVASLLGGYQVLRLLAGLAVLYFLPLALRRMCAPQHAGRLFAATFTGVALGLVLVVTLATTLTDMASPDGSVRYLVPSLLCLLLLAVVAIVDDLGLSVPQRAAGLLLLAVLATSAPFTFVLPYLREHGVPRQWLAPTADQRLLAFLRSQGLQYGYGDFWQAGKLSVLSNQAIRIRQVQYQQGVPLPLRMLSSNHWYQPQAWQGQSFLLLRSAELAQVDSEFVARQLGASVRTLAFEDWRILVFSKNLALLPAWDRAQQRPIHFPISSRTPKLVGEFDATQPALVAAPGVAGTLYYGPFLRLEPGRYQVSFALQADGAAPQFGHVDVASSAGAQQHARQDITAAGRQRITLEFSTARGLDATEFRVFSNGAGRLAVHDVTLLRLDDNKM